MNWQSNSAKSSGARNGGGKVSFRHFPMVVSLAMLVVAGSVVFLKSNTLSSNAIDEAALAAARKMSEIVVNTPECGFVSLSDQPSDGRGTECGDRFSSPVRGINTLIGTARLDLIIADKLDQSLMEQFAEKDLKDVLAAKQNLIAEIEKSMQPGLSATDKDGRPVSVYKSAVDAYYKFARVAASSDKNWSLRLSIGSLDNGLPTIVPIPAPELYAAVEPSMVSGTFYKSYINIPYNGRNFVFGGIGANVQVVDHKNWRAKIDDLPYQIPTIVKVALIKSVAGGAQQEVSVACAQPASQVVASVEPGALTISFPDGPVPEIKCPADCYLNEKLNSRGADAMDLLTADGGDYPTDSGSVMRSMEWPLTGSVTEVCTADVWRQALYDWIRAAGPTANINSVVGMQKVLLDAPRPAKIMWNVPVSIGTVSKSIAPISTGIVHIFEFDRNGNVVYRSKIQAPYPLDTVSHHQLFGENFGALDHSEIGISKVTVLTSPVPKRITLLAAWDVFVRDHVRVRGTISGGKHAGQPIAKPILASQEQAADHLSVLEEPLSLDLVSDQSEEAEFAKGRVKPFGKGRVGIMGAADAGYPPLISPQSDFCENMTPRAPFVRPMPFGSGARPLLKASAVDIRFRREVDVSEFTGIPSTGYFGIIQTDK